MSKQNQPITQKLLKDEVDQHSVLSQDNLVVLHKRSHLYEPQSPITLTFENISYSVEIQKKAEGSKFKKVKETKHIIKNVSGVFKAGEVSAILGASGAGKTSLLNIVACRISHKSKGKLCANNKEYTYDTFGDFANYVMQSDLLMQTLTVRQTLTFAADLTIKASETQKKTLVEELVKSLKLQNCLDVLVGGNFVKKGISGGEKKRTSIAFELISDPQVVVLDEPTSGLDSLTSFIIVDYLSNLAKKHNKTIIMTIHQPSTDIYNKFDRLFLMVEGEFAYQGAADAAENYFKNNFNWHCDTFVNTAQFLIKNVHPDNPENVKNYSNYLKNYEENLAPRVEKQIQQVESIRLTKREIDVSGSVVLTTLLKRDAINVYRNPMMLRSRLIQSIFMGLYSGGLYFQLGQQNYEKLPIWFSLAGFFYFLSMSSFMFALGPVTLVFPNQRLIFLKQQNARLYRVFSYFLSRNAIEIPYLVIMPLFFNLIFYWMVGLAATTEQFFLNYLINFLIGLCGSSLGLLLGSLAKDPKSVAAMIPLILTPFIMFSGFLKNSANFPAWLGWIQYLSPIKYGLASMALIQVKYRPSLVEQFNFDVDIYESVVIMLGLSLLYRGMSLFFLWWMRTKIE